MGYGRAACGLGSEEADWLVFDQAELDEFAECFANLGNQGASGHWHYYVVRPAPTPLLCDLVASRFRAFGVVGAKIDVYQSPLVASGDLRAEAVHLVVVAVDPYQVRSVDAGVQNLGRLEVR